MREQCFGFPTFVLSNASRISRQSVNPVMCGRIFQSLVLQVLGFAVVTLMGMELRSGCVEIRSCSCKM